MVGDSIMADPMPKSGFAADSQAKLVVGAIAAELAGAQKFPPRLRNTCWSLLAHANTVKMGASYAVKGGKLEVVNSFASPLEEPVLTPRRIPPSTSIATGT